MAAAMCIKSLVVLLCCSSWTTAKAPGFRTALTNKGLSYICKVAVPILEKELSRLSIPEISGSADTPIGTVDYWLTNIQMSDLNISKSSLTTSNQGLVIQAADISLHVYADWQYRESSWPHIEDHGNCHIDAYEVSLEINIAVTADSSGHAVLKSDYCHLYIDKLEIDFHGGASWLYNLFSNYIANDLKGSIESQVCSVAVNEIETKGNSALASIPVNVKISSTVEIDFAMIHDPIFTKSYVETDHKGEFYDIGHRVEAPFTPPQLPAVTEHTNMLYMWLTDYMADTAGFVYQTAGALHYIITPSMVPPSFPFQLNTSYFKEIVPQLYSTFPNWNMELELNATKPPLLTLASSGGKFTVFGDVIVWVLQPGNSSHKERAFVLGVTVHATATIYLKTNSGDIFVCGNTTFLKIELSLIGTNIGKFNVDVLQDVANLLSTMFIIPSINRYVNSGFPIPTIDGISLKDASIKFGKDYAVVAADILYTKHLV